MGLVHLHVPLVVLLEALQELLPHKALLARHALQHFLDARHHALEPTAAHRPHSCSGQLPDNTTLVMGFGAVLMGVDAQDAKLVCPGNWIAQQSNEVDAR